MTNNAEFLVLIFNNKTKLGSGLGWTSNECRHSSKPYSLPARLMRYRPTPLNILSGLLLGFAIYSAIRPGPMGFGFLAFWFLLPLGCLGLLADFLLQKFQKSYIRTFTIELLFIGIVAFGYSWTQRTKTFIIHDKLSSIYIVTIYGVDTAPKLPLDFLTWNYEIKIPDNGILLTSSNFTSDLPETEMKTYSGIKLNSENTELGFIRFSEDEINCNGKKYKYRSWMIDRHCCMYSSKDVDTLKVRLQNQICRQSQAGNIGFVQVGQDVVTSAICRHQQ